MEFQDVVRGRRMVREFTDEPVAEASVRRIVDNAVRGPSAGYAQGQGFLVLQGEDAQRFVTNFGSWAAESVRTAQVVVVPFAVKEAYLERYARPDKAGTGMHVEEKWPVPYWYVDTGMAVLLILQTAVDEGLGAVYFGVGTDDWDALRAEYGVPETHVPIGAVAIGHSAEDEADRSWMKRRRLAREETIHFGRWNQG